MKKHFLLPILLLVSSLLVAAFGGYLKYGLFAKLQLDTEENIISLPFVLLTDEQLSYRFRSSLEAYYHPAAAEPTSPQETDATVAVTVPFPPETEPTETVPAEPAYIALEDSWFDDALFIGESRIDGLKLTARLGKAEYFSDTGVSVFNVLNIAASDRQFSNTSLNDLLSWKKYGKIIIHLGINECGKYPDAFQAQYRQVIEYVRKKQPDAYIILHSILPVTQGYAGNGLLQPANIALYNERIQTLVTDEKIRYIDAGAWCTDAEGFLRTELTNDGCHPHGEGNQQWAQWIKEACGWLCIP